MAVQHGDGPDLLLGKSTSIPAEYAPHILYPIPRAAAREQLGLRTPLCFVGADIWHAYELSWLDDMGKPQVRVGRFRVPSSSPNMVESKSLKLYLNSLNNHRFASVEQAGEVIGRDIGAVVGAAIEMQLFRVDDPQLSGVSLPGQCLDELPVTLPPGPPTITMLLPDKTSLVEEKLYTHLLRSLCPVTGQPDWASVLVHYRGNAIEHASLLRYLLAYWQHQEFHEQCVERIFSDIHAGCAPEYLSVQAFYTRRGGLDINPFRSTDAMAVPLPRLNRQ